MRDFINKIDNDSTAAGVVVAAEYNSIFSEAKNVVSPFFGFNANDNQQMLKSIDVMTKSLFYNDTGTANTILLSRSSTTTQSETLFDGMVLMFTPKVQNTGATTLKVKQLDSKPLFYKGAELESGVLKTDKVYTVKYSTSLNRFDIIDNFGAGGSSTDLLSNGFTKPVTDSTVFTKTGAASFNVLAGTKIVVGDNVISLESNYSLSLNTDLDTGSKIAGSDYYVYVETNGNMYISLDNSKPDRLIGGFHYGLTGESEAPTGNKTESDMVAIRGINAHSFWDLKFRPSCNPKGMFFAHGNWYDIYLCNSEHITNGTSKAGTTIAGGALTNGRLYPKIPLIFGGDNSTTYGSFKWWHASEIARSHGKRLISQEEFGTIAYGVTEQDDASSVDGGGATVEHYDFLTSKYGMEQATGTQWIWGADTFALSTSGTYQAVTEGRGSLYSNPNEYNAVLLGGYRGNGTVAGSRAAGSSSYLWNTDWDFGSRFASDHLQLV